MAVTLPPVTKPVPINGSPVDNPDRPPVRRELRDLKKNHPKEWALFLLGLESFKKTPEDHPLSWFQIAGIHGRPFTNWPAATWNTFIKAVDPKQTDPTQWKGFCTHSSILFLPWHRPYLSLFESELRRHVKAAAEEYTPEEGRAEYIQAAKDFRLPYWDWALPASKDNGVFPQEALAETQHNIQFPKSRKVKSFETNPLASYKFGQLGASDGVINKFKKINATIRWPSPDNATPDEIRQRDELRAWLKSPTGLPGAIKKGKNLTERVLFLLQSYDAFGAVSSNYFFGDGQGQFANWGSLEDIHNSLHFYIGENGHMGDPAIAAFDPIFWLHHANIDRLYAIWQAIWDEGGENQYVKPKDAKQTDRARGGTYSNNWRGEDNIDTELTPFATSEKGTMWTSRGVRSTTTFGYVYPETRWWEYPDRNAVLGHIETIYPNASLANNMKIDKDRQVAATEALKSRANSLLALEATTLNTASLVQIASVKESDAHQQLIAAAQEAAPPAERTLADLVKDNKYLEWLVDIRAEKHSLGGNFVVHVFLDPPDDDNPALYIADPNHVAVFSTFGTDENTGCENCKNGQEAHLKVTGQIPLTLALVERYLAGKLQSIESGDVIPYLQKNLHWRVTDKSGVRGSRADVSGLLVSVVSNEVTLPEEANALPQYAPNVTPWAAATTRENGEGRGRGTGYTES